MKHSSVTESPAGKTLLVVMDPITRIYYQKDTTLALLWAAAERGWSLFYAEQSDLYLRDGQAFGRVKSLQVFHDAENWFAFGETFTMADVAVAPRVKVKRTRIKRTLAVTVTPKRAGKAKLERLNTNTFRWKSVRTTASSVLSMRRGGRPCCGCRCVRWRSST